MFIKAAYHAFGNAERREDHAIICTSVQELNLWDR